MLPIVVAVLAICYLALIVVLRIGLEKSDAPQAAGAPTEPSVAVIVAARNEEEHIGRCLESLLAVDYPPEKLEIIVVNDHSSDRTHDVAASYGGRHPGLRVIDSHRGTENLHGKANALAQGIAASHGEIIMLTDADCAVPASWVRATVAAFAPPVGIVGGFTLLNDDSPFHGVQMLDWIFLFGLASAMAGWRRPLTVVGNNLSFRREAYDAVGGYAKIPFSVTEDYALVRTILRTTGYRVAFPVSKSTAVASRACESWSQLFRQKQRWGVGGLDMVWEGNLIMLVAWLTRLMVIAGAIVHPGLTVLVAALAVMAADLRILTSLLARFGRARALRYFPLFELYLTAYGLVLPFVAFFSRRVVWKERTL